MADENNNLPVSNDSSSTVVVQTLRTYDAEGNIIDVHPITEMEAVEGYEEYVKGVDCDDHTLTITTGNGDIKKVEINNEVLTDEEIINLWNDTIPLDY